MYFYVSSIFCVLTVVLACTCVLYFCDLACNVEFPRRCMPLENVSHSVLQGGGGGGLGNGIERPFVALRHQAMLEIHEAAMILQYCTNSSKESRGSVAQLCTYLYGLSEAIHFIMKSL